ncbi:MAG: type VI secretion system baseplate subunit TssG [Casimicrobiaceae bacterium]
MNETAQPALTPSDLPSQSAARPDVDGFIAAIAAEPWRYDLWHVLRWLDAKHPSFPPLGRSPKADLEPLRVGQEPSLAFAPGQLHSLKPGEDGRLPRLSILGFGLFGPNGPLPLHLTEYARERVLNHDHTLVRFADILHHRFTLLFYRAWADTQSTVSLDRPGDDRFSRYTASLIHLGEASLRDRDAVADHAKLFVSGHLVRQTRNAEGLERILATFFRAGVRIEQWVSQWLVLAREQRTRLGAGRDAEQIGIGAVAGERVPDAQCKFRIRFGPLSLAEYESHLPEGKPFAQMLAWLRNYIGYELAWDVRLVLRREEVPRAKVGGSMRLGWTTWLGERRQDDDADDLVLVHETIVARQPQVAR